MLKIQELGLSGLKLLTNDVFIDERGSFQELYHRDKYQKAGLDTHFVQDNLSCSKKNVVRGMHFQWDAPLTKLMRVVRGRLLAVAVDIRIDSPTLGKHVSVELSTERAESLFVPFGFATGICALVDDVSFVYKYSSFYNPKGESNIRFDDPELNIQWPTDAPILSPRDKEASLFKEWLIRPESKLFTMESSCRNFSELT